jgi:hypothetical protein
VLGHLGCSFRKAAIVRAGIILNNQMDDFSTPDQVNVYGLPPSEPNFIRPFKKPQSSMSPLVVVNADGRVRAILGASGGPRIISALIQTLFRSALSCNGATPDPCLLTAIQRSSHTHACLVVQNVPFHNLHHFHAVSGYLALRL